MTTEWLTDIRSIATAIATLAAGFGLVTAGDKSDQLDVLQAATRGFEESSDHFQLRAERIERQLYACHGIPFPGGEPTAPF
jgi:hypothetical protein